MLERTYAAYQHERAFDNKCLVTPLARKYTFTGLVLIFSYLLIHEKITSIKC